MFKNSNLTQSVPNGMVPNCLFASKLKLGLVCVVVVFVLLTNGPALAQSKQASGSSHRSYRNEAARAIPLGQMNKVARQRISSVVKNPSFYRRLPVTTVDADPEYFRLLVRKPELIVSIWQLMGVTQMTTERTGPFTVKSNDGAGTTSELELVYGNDNVHVFYGDGSYTGSMLKNGLSGRCVIFLRTNARETKTGFDLTNTLDIFLKVDNAAASLVTRTIQPIVGPTADHNFTESLKFVQRLNRSTRDNGPGVKDMGRRLEINTETRQEFNKVVDQVYYRAYEKRTGQSVRQDVKRPVKQKVAKPALPQQTVSIVSPPPSGVVSQLTKPKESAALTTTGAKAFAKSAPAKPSAADLSTEGFSILVGGPLPRQGAPKASFKRIVTAAAAPNAADGSVPAARSADRSVFHSFSSPPFNPQSFNNTVPGRFIPVHRAPIQ